ncbi:MAG: APC family permease [Ruminococcaceae bacterium]|nr:APC family permease [Oscillospiraceae bacterium]
MDKNKISKLGLWCYTLGGAIGAGMFVTLPAAIEVTGLSIVLAIVATSIICFFAYWYCAAISSFASVKGGDYGHIAFVSSPLISGVFGITVIFYVVSNCTYATGALDYAGYALPFLKDNMMLWGVMLMTAFILIDAMGAKLGSKVSTAMTVTLTLGIILFIVMGLPHCDFGTMFAGAGESGEPFFKNGFSGFSQAIGYCIWVVGGIGTCAITFSRNVKNPTKAVPQAIVAITVILGIIACLLCVVCVGAVPMDIAAQGLGAVAMETMPKMMFFAFAIGAGAFALLTSLQTFIAGYREGLLEYAEQGFLPKIFTKKTKGGYPYVVGIFIWLLSVVPFVMGITLDTIVAYTGAPVYFCYMYVNWKCMKLPEQYPDLWKKSMFHMPVALWKGLCIFATACAAYLVYCYCAGFTLRGYIEMAATIGAMFLYAWYRMKKGHVDVKAMEAEKAEIIAEAISYEG